MENNPQSVESQDWGSVEDGQYIEIHPAYKSDRHFYRVVAWSLSAIVILSMMGSLWLTYLDKNIPEAIVALGSTAVGALAGVLAGSKS
ncbi:MAG: hypothetical protein OMM_10982 [Candidatus Magnetoglobus multicellularis str. Araruama]|uniref:Uncharacterized protein n=1 Tax=Candidatus Magnetoglobus multicellularis str. Araruama TaxID=890399 RepID=A0A1V1NZQ7_9BACT|nr:MAG: hypothetical protein OMM_10982 [Candidatus Magnetoglobus multicellularis str. Araruama]